MLKTCPYDNEECQDYILCEECDRYIEKPNLRDEIAKIINSGIYKDDTPIEIADQILALIEGQRCEWTPFYVDDNSNWNSGCGKEWFFDEGDPDFELTPFCPFCGKRISIGEVKDEDTSQGN